jgi:hypothetical protein
MVDCVEVGSALMGLISGVVVGSIQRSSLFLKQATTGHILVLFMGFG